MLPQSGKERVDLLKNNSLWRVDEDRVKQIDGQLAAALNT